MPIYGVNNYPSKSDVPAEWLSTICNCPEVREYWDTNKSLTLCHYCNKLKWYHLWECNNCGNIFMKDFHHPAFNRRNPICFYCLETISPDSVCDDYPPAVIRVHVERGKVKPQFRRLWRHLDPDFVPPVVDFNAPVKAFSLGD